MAQNNHKENQLLYNNEIFPDLIAGGKKRKSNKNKTVKEFCNVKIAFMRKF